MNLDFGKFDWNEMFSSITRAQFYNNIFWFPKMVEVSYINTGIFKNNKIKKSLA